MMEDLLLKYHKDVENLRKNAKQLNLSDDEIDRIFAKCFCELNTNQTTFSRLIKLFKIVFVLVFILLFIFILLYHHQPTLSLVLRNVQGFIYPGLKVLRLLALPVIKLFPSLSEYYDESCLLENPYFHVSNMECWPCENIHSVINLTGAQNYTLYQSGIPYIVQTLNKTVSLDEIKNIYKTNYKIFDQDAHRLDSNNPQLQKVENLLNFTGNNSNTHISWRINRMSPARIIRKLFPKPHVVTAWSGQSTERFILIDDLKAGPYVLPNPECGFVVITQGQGERTIVLKPSQECSNYCRTTSVTLRAKYSLWYNWWYWRPISLPSQTKNQSEISISYISSYC